MPGRSGTSTAPGYLGGWAAWLQARPARSTRSLDRASVDRPIWRTFWAERAPRVSPPSSGRRRRARRDSSSGARQTQRRRPLVGYAESTGDHRDLLLLALRDAFASAAAAGAGRTARQGRRPSRRPARPGVGAGARGRAARRAARELCIDEERGGRRRADRAGAAAADLRRGVRPHRVPGRDKCTADRPVPRRLAEDALPSRGRPPCCRASSIEPTGGPPATCSSGSGPTASASRKRRPA